MDPLIPKFKHDYRTPRIEGIETHTCKKVKHLAQKTFEALKLDSHHSSKNFPKICKALSNLASRLLTPIYTGTISVCRCALQIFYKFPVSSVTMLSTAINKPSSEVVKNLKKIQADLEMTLDVKDLNAGICFGMVHSFISKLKSFISTGIALNESILKKSAGLFSKGGGILEVALQEAQKHLLDGEPYIKFMDSTLELKTSATEIDISLKELDQLKTGLYYISIQHLSDEASGQPVVWNSHAIACIVTEDQTRYIFDPNMGLMKAKTPDAFSKICRYYQRHSQSTVQGSIGITSLT